MSIDLIALYNVCTPDAALDVANETDRQYYIDFTPVRGAQVVEDICQKISFKRNKRTCQLFTGHMGCGKSTELSKLRLGLEEQGFAVVLFQPELNMGNLEVMDILAAVGVRLNEEFEDLIPKPPSQGGFKDFYEA